MPAGIEAEDTLLHAKEHVSNLLDKRYGTEEALPLWRAYRLLCNLRRRVIADNYCCVRTGCGKPVTHWDQVRNEKHGFCDEHGE